MYFKLCVLTGSEKEQEKCQILADLINQVITIQSFKKLDRSIRSNIQLIGKKIYS